MQNYAATLKLQNGKNVMENKGWKVEGLMKGYPNTTLGFPKQFCSHLKVTKNFTYLDL